MAFLGKEMRKSEKPPIRMTADFLSSAYELTKGYNCVPNPLAFFDGRRDNSKQVDICMVLGMDKEIAPLLDEWTMDLTERGIDTKKAMPTSSHVRQIYLSGRTNRSANPSCGEAVQDSI